MDTSELPSLEEIKQSAWYQERPDIIKEAINRTPPTAFYKFKDSGKECYIVGYSEPDASNTKVTLIVQKTGKGGSMAEMGLGTLDTNQVFGVDPEDLEPIEDNAQAEG